MQEKKEGREGVVSIQAVVSVCSAVGDLLHEVARTQYYVAFSLICC